MYDYNCGRCGGLVPEPMKAYGYAGRYCHCAKPKPSVDKATINTIGTTTNPMSQNKSVEEIMREIRNIQPMHDLVAERIEQLFIEERQTSQEREREIVERIKMGRFAKVADDETWNNDNVKGYKEALKDVAEWIENFTNPNKD